MRIKRLLTSISIVILLISTIVFSAFAFINDTSIKESDNSYNLVTSDNIRKAIISYIVDTEDYDLTFGEEAKKNVEVVISNLYKRNYLEDESYKPRKHRFFGFFTENNLGWRIVINKKDIEVSVSVCEKNELIFNE